MKMPRGKRRGKFGRHPQGRKGIKHHKTGNKRTIQIRGK